MKIIFHVPFILGKHNPQSASGIRPQKMLQAFQQMGYDVEVITGFVGERKNKIQELKRRIKAGERFSFVYSESTTMPNAFNSSNRLPLNPFFDYSFFRFCRRNQIPVGLFYRDVFWRYPFYAQRVGKLKSLLLKPFFYFDLLQYRGALDRLFLPAIGYGERLPIVSPKLFSELPPGCDDVEDTTQSYIKSQSLLYVGGIGEHYKMQEAFKAITQSPGARLTVCTREIEWRAAASTYPRPGDEIEIVHRSGKELDELYQGARYGSIFVQVDEYWKIAVPLKLYEYLAQAKPVIASEGSYTATLVRKLGIGWVLPYKAEALVNFLNNNAVSFSEYKAIVDHMRAIRSNHTWLRRAEQVSDELINLR